MDNQGKLLDFVNETKEDTKKQRKRGKKKEKETNTDSFKRRN